eukprot:2319154-Amphidinium_carterae.1
METVVLHEPLIGDWVFRLIGHLAPGDSLWPGSVYAFRQHFSLASAELGLGAWQLQPHSLRRGGATAKFLVHGSYDRLMHQGRWMHLKTCRLYIDEARQTLLTLEYAIPQTPAAVKASASPAGDAWKVRACYVGQSAIGGTGECMKSAIGGTGDSDFSECQVGKFLMGLVLVSHSRDWHSSQCQVVQLCVVPVSYGRDWQSSQWQ